MPGFFDSVIRRIYSCENKDCLAKVGYDQKITANFKKKCPVCKKNTLLLYSGELNTCIIMDSKQPKTIGSLGEKNYQNAEKEGKDIFKRKNAKIPFWRNDRQVNIDALKNPSKYIETGKI